MLRLSSAPRGAVRRRCAGRRCLSAMIGSAAVLSFSVLMSALPAPALAQAPANPGELLVYQEPVPGRTLPAPTAPGMNGTDPVIMNNGVPQTVTAPGNGAPPLPVVPGFGGPPAATPGNTAGPGGAAAQAPGLAPGDVIMQTPTGPLTPDQLQKMIAAAIKANDDKKAADKKLADAQKQAEDAQKPQDWWKTVSIDLKDGFLVKTKDDQFSLRINDLIQADYRDFSHTAQGVHSPTSLQDNFTIAREWLFFRGSATEFLDYQTIIAAGAATSGIGPANVNLLDAWVDLNPFGKAYKEYFQIRVGRMKTPFLYQFYKLMPQDFVTPELSMFGTTLIPNRQIGLMAHGLLFDKRFDYAAGVFNGVPNSFDVVQSDRQAVMYLGLYPFINNCDSPFRYLVLAGAYAFGDQNGPVAPANLGTAAPANGPPNNTLISPTFLEFPATTLATGMHQLWNFDLVWSYKSFNLYGELSGGRQRYALASAPGSNFPVSVSGYSIAATYFLTGEEITPERKRIKPNNPYSWQCGGCGAFEVFGRFSNLVLGSTVFTDKLANPALFANSVNATDVGVNWYWNEYIRLIFDWQHANFNNPVSWTGAAGGNATKNQDIFWWRFQVYF